jgi:Ni2+-binding GTPase involved in maturation of urease and hydrogenase
MLLMSVNKKVAVITNDQGDQQVDTAFVKSCGITSLEVAKGCFCCNYQELDRHLQTLEETQRSDIIFAESVGSCTDLIATVVNPLNRFKPGLEIVISIFADAELLNAIIEGKSTFQEESVRYIYKKQLEEADILILNKADLLSGEQIKNLSQIITLEYPGKTILHQNSLNESDILTWLSCIESFTPNGRSPLAIDYDVYGKGESKLAWLDKYVEIHATHNNAIFISRWLIRSIVDPIQSMHINIGHLKFFLETSSHKQKISITTTSTSADVQITIPEATNVAVLINARVETDPELLRQLVNNVLANMEQRFDCQVRVGRWSAFKPGVPRPLYRMT